MTAEGDTGGDGADTGQLNRRRLCGSTYEAEAPHQATIGAQQRTKHGPIGEDGGQQESVDPY